MTNTTPTHTTQELPIHLWTQGSTRAHNAPPAILVGANGAFVSRTKQFWRYMERVSSLAVLASVTPFGEWRLPKIPAPQTLRMIEFFRTVYEKHHSEAILLIAYNAVTGTFELVAPRQQVSGAHCDYDMPRDAPAGSEFVGTVHSHGNMSAFHSGTDTHDEKAFDGIHLTVGHVDEDDVGIVASLKVGDQRFPLEPQDVLDGVRRCASLTFTPHDVTDAEVDAGVARAIEYLEQHQPDLLSKYRGPEGRAKIRNRLETIAGKEVAALQARARENAQGYRCIFPDGLAKKDVRPPSAWMDCVDERWNGGASVGSMSYGSWTYRGKSSADEGYVPAHAYTRPLPPHGGSGYDSEPDEPVGGSGGRLIVSIYGPGGRVERTVPAHTPAVVSSDGLVGGADQAMDRSFFGAVGARLGSVRDRAMGRHRGPPDAPAPRNASVSGPRSRSRGKRSPGGGSGARRHTPHDDDESYGPQFPNVRCIRTGGHVGFDSDGVALFVGDVVRVSVAHIVCPDAANRTRVFQPLFERRGRCVIVHAAYVRESDRTFLYLDIGVDVGGVAIPMIGRGAVPIELDRDPTWWSRIVGAWSDHVQLHREADDASAGPPVIQDPLVPL